MTSSTFIEYDPDSVRKGSKKPHFLFVQCGETNGRTSHSRAVIQRHAIQNYFQTSRYGLNGSSEACELDEVQVKNELSYSESGKTTTTQVTQLKKRRRRKAAAGPKNHNTSPSQVSQHILGYDSKGDPSLVVTPTSTGVSPFKTVDDFAVDDACRWFSYGHDASVGREYQVAKHHFLDACWDMTRDHEIFLGGITLYACRKRLHLQGQSSDNVFQYMKRKGNLIRQIQKEIDTHGQAIDSRTLATIPILAFCHLQDGESDAARFHFEALHRIRAVERMTKEEWLYGAWLDIRFALFRSKPPIFDHYIPQAYSLVDLGHRQEANKLAKKYSSLVPLSTTCGFEEFDAITLFSRLCELYLAWPELADTRIPPYGHIYSLEFHLRTLHPAIMNAQSIENESTCAELIVIAVQLHLWIVTRFWTPIAHSVRLCILRRAHVLISSCTLLTLWKTSEIDHGSLLWMLSTICACALDDLHPGAGVALSVLLRVIDEMKIEDEETFLMHLRFWPWLDNWHSWRLPRLWRTLKTYKTVCFPSDFSSAETAMDANCPWWQTLGAPFGPDSFGL